MAHIALIDGDVIAYRACQPRGPIQVNKYGFKAVKGDVTAPKKVITYTPEEDEAYIEESWERFQSMTMDLREMASADYFMMAVKGPNNFRDLIFPQYEPDANGNLSKGYKANRNKYPEHRNPFVPRMRQMAVDHGIAIAAHGREADDFLRIWATEAEQAGDTYTVASIDKDLKCIHGRHLLIDKRVLMTVTKNYATRFFYEQLLQGDPTDNIPGIPGIGPKKAEALLEAYDTEHEFQAVVIEAYQEKIGDDWESNLLANGKLLYLQKNPNDYFNIRGWARFG